MGIPDRLKILPAAAVLLAAGLHPDRAHGDAIEAVALVRQAAQTQPAEISSPIDPRFEPMLSVARERALNPHNSYAVIFEPSFRAYAAQKRVELTDTVDPIQLISVRPFVGVVEREKQPFIIHAQTRLAFNKEAFLKLSPEDQYLVAVRGFSQFSAVKATDPFESFEGRSTYVVGDQMTSKIVHPANADQTYALFNAAEQAYLMEVDNPDFSPDKATGLTALNAEGNSPLLVYAQMVNNPDPSQRTYTNPAFQRAVLAPRLTS